jgi:hypothetical protein
VITTLSGHCWNVVDAHGNPYDDPGYEPHYPNLDEASDQAEELNEELDEEPPPFAIGPFEPRQLPERCWIATCDGCGQHLDNGESICDHYVDEANAIQVAQDSDWLVEGRNAFCEDCWHIRREAGVPPGVVPLPIVPLQRAAGAEVGRG